MNTSLIKAISWFARILGSIIVLFVLFMFIAYAVNPQGSGKMNVNVIPLMIGMIAMMVGLVVAWFRELIGGLLTIGGFIFFLVIEMTSSQGFDAWFLVIFPIIALLHLFCWWKKRLLSSTEA